MIYVKLLLVSTNEKLHFYQKKEQKKEKKKLDRLKKK